MDEVDAFSLTTVPVEQLANGTPMKSATALVWKHGPQHYLITNWHVVTGKNAYTGNLETPAAPDMLRCLFNIRIGTFGKQQWDIRIRDDNHKPLWLIRPGMGRSDPAIWLSQEMIARCAGLPVIVAHPPGGTLDGDELAQRIIGTIVFSFVRGDELWGVARIIDDDTARALADLEWTQARAWCFRARATTTSCCRSMKETHC